MNFIEKNSNNEYVEISNYFEQIDIYKKIITTYLSDE